MTDATDFKQASQAVWDAMAPEWDRRHAYCEERARPLTEKLVERLAPGVARPSWSSRRARASSASTRRYSSDQAAG